jgi:hypothetical protein
MVEVEGAPNGPGRPPPSARRSWWRWALRWSGVGVVAVLVAIQLVPYGWWHANPSVVRDAPWPDERSASIARTSCYSCHSNETDWPPYSYVAPMSWLVRADVEDGRAELNFSDWDEYADEAEDAIEAVSSGEMPLGRYTFVHRDAELTDEEAQVLIGALGRMSAAEGGEER